MQIDLVAHADHPVRLVGGVSVELVERADVLEITYRISGGPLRWPEPDVPERTDGLWRTTCFELFARPAGSEAYVEWNFSPSGRWAAYAFESHRSGMRDLPAPAPHIAAFAPGGATVTLPRAALPPAQCAIGFTAVVEEADGTRSLWAICHPPGAADFHHPACAALQLPAAA